MNEAREELSIRRQEERHLALCIRRSGLPFGRLHRRIDVCELFLFGEFVEKWPTQIGDVTSAGICGWAINEESRHPTHSPLSASHATRTELDPTFLSLPLWIESLLGTIVSAPIIRLV